jgi:hypothetical protein
LSVNILLRRKKLEKAKGDETLEEKDRKIAAYTDSSDILKTAQEMVKSIMENASEEEQAEKVESGLSSEEIETLNEERRAVIEEMAARISIAKTGPGDKESKEIVQEAWENWGDELK